MKPAPTVDVAHPYPAIPRSHRYARSRPLRFAKGAIGYDYWMQRRFDRVDDRPRRSRGATRREVEPVLLPGGVSEEEEADRARDWWRLFVAIELPRRALRVLDGMANSMRAESYGGRQRRRPSRGAVAYDAVRWTAPENMHLTLKFLGDVHRDDLGYLKEELDEVAAESSSLRLELGVNGCFPGERTPRVLWTGLEGDLRRMSSLATKLEGAMVRCGFPEDGREFKPHVTVGRVRSGTQKRVLAAIGQRWLEARPSSEGDDVGVPVASMVLMRSHLHHNRPTRYERLYEVELG